MVVANGRSQYAGAFWKARDEDLGSSAKALSEFLGQLAILDDSWSSWYEAVPPGAPMRSIDSAASIEMLFGPRARHDAAKDVNARHVVTLWNGVDEGISLHFRCGFRTAVPGLPFPNACTVDIRPYSQPTSVLSPAFAEKIVTALVSSFRPDWAVVSCSAVDALRGERRGGPRVGWVTYLRTQKLPKTLPAGISSRPLGDGTIMVVMADSKATDAAEKDRLSRVEGLMTILDETGCLDPSSL